MTSILASDPGLCMWEILSWASWSATRLVLFEVREGRDTLMWVIWSGGFCGGIKMPQRKYIQKHGNSKTEGDSDPTQENGFQEEKTVISIQGTSWKLDECEESARVKSPREALAELMSSPPFEDSLKLSGKVQRPNIGTNPRNNANVERNRCDHHLFGAKYGCSGFHVGGNCSHSRTQQARALGPRPTCGEHWNGEERGTVYP